MSIESVFFRKLQCDFPTLVPFGFQRTYGEDFPGEGLEFSSDGALSGGSDDLSPSGWTYTEDFHDGQFRAALFVSEEGEVLGTVFDLDLDEEFLPLQNPNETGAFVGTIREEYTEILRRIAEHCFYPLPFAGPQANRIAAKIREKWGDTPERTFAKYPDYGIYRHPDSGKWYGAVLPVSQSLLQKNGEAPKKKPARKRSGPSDRDARPEDEVEILNVKVPNERRDEFLNEPGFYLAYHMNKQSWVSVLLDDTVPDRQILGLLEVSRRLTERGTSSRAGKSGKRIDTWLVPANPKYYDIEAAFEHHDEILWKQSTNVQIGDIAYMYVAAPVSAILFKCEITETDIPYHHDGNVKIRKVMKIRFLEKYRRDQFPLRVLKAHGVGTVQGCHGLPAETEAYIRKHS